ncbi:MAG: FKBP-type peptidyl-prolyl cis-trans isomerase [Actinomycetaceae bacterium]|nr:FKBP-type peptidyl-prolyl cis-trans isomerase [Actinomycetaceae bacterium]
MISVLSLGALAGCSSTNGNANDGSTPSPAAHDSTDAESASVPVDRNYDGAIPEVEGEYAKSATILPSDGAEPTDTVVAHTITAGDGPEVTAHDFVSAHYVGSLWDGEVFDSSFARSPGENPTPAVFSLQQVIQGWTYGLEGQHVGDRVELIIPSTWGYGDQAQGDKIPANSTLVFVVDIVDAVNPADYSALEEAEKTTNDLPAGMAVKGDLAHKPTVTFDKDATPPADDVAIVLARGTGDPVKETDVVIFHATVGEWGKEAGIESSWDQGEAQSSGQPAGDSPGITGMPVGSRTFITLKQENPGEHPLFAIIDIVAVVPNAQ